MPNITTAIGFITLKRIYAVGPIGRKTVKTQPVQVRVSEIESFRLRKKKELGNNHKTTVITKGGRYYNVAESVDQIVSMLGRSSR